MKLKINGKEYSCGKEIRLSDLILEKKLKADRIVIEHNCEIVSQDKWDDITLRSGDNLEIVSFVGGG